jgi:hypothetical protein
MHHDNDQPLCAEERLARQVTRFKRWLKPEVMLVNAHLTSDGNVEATVCLPDGRKAPVLFVELDDDEDDEEPDESAAKEEENP